MPKGEKQEKTIAVCDVEKKRYFQLVLKNKVREVLGIDDDCQIEFVLDSNKKVFVRKS